MLEPKYYDFLDNMYRILKCHDAEILKYFNDENISDKDYFFYGINNDLISNTIHILINYLSGNIESPGVDISCRIIIESLTILAMDAHGDINDLQKKIYRYSYAYVDLFNFKNLINDEILENKNLEQLIKDKNICKKAILEHFKCSEKDLDNKLIFLDDPCFYLKKRLKDRIKFDKLIKKYFPNNNYLSNFYSTFSIFIHPRCELNPQFEEEILKIRTTYVDAIIQIVYDYLMECKLIKETKNINSFNDDLWYNPLLKNNVNNIKEMERSIHLIKEQLCFFKDGEDVFTWFLLEKIRYIIIDMQMSLTLGYKENAISCYKTFIELFAVYYHINTLEMNDFNILKKAYWLSSRLQLIDFCNKAGVEIDTSIYKEDIDKLFNDYYKDKYNIEDENRFISNMTNNSLYFLSNEKKSFNKVVNDMINDYFGSEDRLKNDLINLYDISKDFCHASGYSFNATVSMIDATVQKVLIAFYRCIINYIFMAESTLKEHGIETNLSSVVSFYKSIMSMHEGELEKLYKEEMKNVN